MIMQVYLLTIMYLLFGAGVLLVDYYGGRLLLLIRMRNAMRTSVRNQAILAGSGLLLTTMKVLRPVPPGPALLGDFFPALFMLVLVVYYLSQTVSYRRKGKEMVQQEAKRFEEEMLHRTASLIELHKRNLGLVIAGTAALHFLFPRAVLL